MILKFIISLSDKPKLQKTTIMQYSPKLIIKEICPIYSTIYMVYRFANEEKVTLKTNYQ